MNFYCRLLNLSGQEIADRFSETDVENPWIELDNDGIYYGMHNAKDAVIVDGVEVEPARIKNYTIEKTDRRTAIAAEQSKKDAREAAKLITKNAKAALNAVKAATNQAELKQATKDLAKVVHALVKTLDLVDPTEAE